MLELAYRADSNSAAREGLWVRVPPAVPDRVLPTVPCRVRPPDPALCVDDLGLGGAYAYLLGLYLGDGMLTLARRDVWRLRISMDASYPEIVDRAKRAILDVAARHAGLVPRTGCFEVYSNWKHWICLFPQHGPGPKHHRTIRLAPWQEQVVQQHPAQFLTGLIHSDGCRCLNRVKGRDYPRYFFSNLSADIRDIFVEACARVGVESRPAGDRNISVARKESVAILDVLIAPKR